MLRLRCLARRPENLRPRVASTTEVVAGDVLDPESLPAAFEGVDTAYYLIHSMGSARDFERDDRQAAANFAAAAKQAGVRRIIYLGGLGNPKHGLSEHLRSRQETGEVLRASGVQVIEFRASIIIGSGSLSFELIRALVERLPIMVCPKWVATPRNPSPSKTCSTTCLPRWICRRARAASSRSAARIGSATATSCGSTPGSAG